MIAPDEIQFYADQLYRFWQTEQRRQADRSYARSPAVDVEYSRTPATPITPGTYFATTPSTPFSPAPNLYPAYQQQQQPHIPQRMEGVTPTTQTFTPRPRNQPNDSYQ